MTRCKEFYDKVEKDGNFCGMSTSSFNQIRQYMEFVKKHPELESLTEGAVKPLIQEIDPKIKANVIDTVKKAIEHGRSPTSKQVKRALAKHKIVEKSTRADFNDLLLTQIRNGEVKHHITDTVIVGIPKEVHVRLSGNDRAVHRQKILKWLKEQADKYSIVKTYLEQVKDLRE